jgi:alpha-glucoside transport system substrate-binding protein
MGRGFHKDSGPVTPERKGQMKKTLKLSAVLSAIALVATVFTTSSASAATAYCKDFTQFGSYKNVTVKVFAGIRDPEASVMTKVFAHFTACTGIKIAYEGTDQF